MAHVAQRKTGDEERGERKEDWDREAVTVDPLLPDYLQPRRMLPCCEVCMKYVLLTTMVAILGAVFGVIVGLFMMLHKTSLGPSPDQNYESEQDKELRETTEFLELLGVSAVVGALSGIFCSAGLKLVCKTATCMRVAARMRRFMQTCEI
jgi:hypothetical protein